MTLIVGVATRDGLVLAGDSRATVIEDDSHHRILSDSSQKVFEVGGMGVGTFGAALIGVETTAALMDQFIAHHGERPPDDIDTFGQALGDFFDQRFRQAVDDWDAEREGFAVGFLVAGYDASGVGHIQRVLIPGAEIDTEFAPSTQTLGVLWQGQTDPIERMIYGVDWTSIEGNGVAFTDDVLTDLKNLQYRLLYPATVQDGVDFAAFLVRTTIDMQRFSDGTLTHPQRVPGCGGPVQILAIERGGPTWIVEPKVTAPSRPGRAEGAV